MPRKTSNSRFSSVLSELIAQRFENNATEMARHVGMSASLIGYYLRPGDKGRFPSQEQLMRLVDPLEEKWQRTLVSAYLYDHIPPNLAGLIRIAGVKGAPAPRSILPKEVETVLDQIREAAARNNDVKHWLLATGRVMFDK